MARRVVHDDGVGAVVEHASGDRATPPRSTTSAAREPLDGPQGEEVGRTGSGADERDHRRPSRARRPRGRRRGGTTTVARYEAGRSAASATGTRATARAGRASRRRRRRRAGPAGRAPPRAPGGAARPCRRRRCGRRRRAAASTRARRPRPSGEHGQPLVAVGHDRAGPGGQLLERHDPGHGLDGDARRSGEHDAASAGNTEYTFGSPSTTKATSSPRSRCADQLCRRPPRSSVAGPSSSPPISMTRRSTATSGAAARTTASARPIASVPVEAANDPVRAAQHGERPLGDAGPGRWADADTDQPGPGRHVRPSGPGAGSSARPSGPGARWPGGSGRPRIGPTGRQRRQRVLEVVGQVDRALAHRS